MAQNWWRQIPGQATVSSTVQPTREKAGNATTAPSDFWASVASSADGTTLVAADSGYGDGLIYISTNSGGSLGRPTIAPVNQWTSVASSADGAKLVAANCRQWRRFDLHFNRFWSHLGGNSARRPTNGLRSPRRRMERNTGGGGLRLRRWLDLRFDQCGTQLGRPPTAPVGYWTSVASSADAANWPPRLPWRNLHLAINAGVEHRRSSAGMLLFRGKTLSSAAGFALQENSDLATTNWVAVTNLPVLTNGLDQVVHPSASQAAINFTGSKAHETVRTFLGARRW
jgi:hypothetical protein